MRRFFYYNSGSVSASYLVDLYSPVVAYSLRKLSSTATNAIRVRRDSDNAEQDIGFSGNNLDTASLLSFISSDSAYIVTWYDQAGSNDLTQSTAASQPQIASSGTINVTSNNNYTIDFSAKYLELSSSISETQYVISVSLHEKPTGGTRSIYGLGSSSGATYPIASGTGGAVQSRIGSTDLTWSGSEPLSTELLSIFYRDGIDDCYLFKNGTGDASNPLSSSLTSDTFNYVNRYASTNGGSTYMSEFIYFNTDKISSISDIALNINTYYGTY